MSSAATADTVSPAQSTDRQNELFDHLQMYRHYVRGRLPYGSAVCAAFLIAVSVLTVACGQSTDAPKHESSKPTLEHQIDGCEQLALDTPDDQSAITACIAAATKERILAAHGDPETVVQVISATRRYSDFAFANSCHNAMHEAGRAVAKQERLEVADLMDYIPNTEDPLCAPGYVHGLMLGIDEHLIQLSGAEARELCDRAATASRRYACVHGLGHAYSRVYDNDVPASLKLCARLGGFRARDCAQGVFHDLQFSYLGADDTQKREAQTPQQTCANVSAEFASVCWFRAFQGNPAATTITDPDGLRAVCQNVNPSTRGACYAGAVFYAIGSPLIAVKACGSLPHAYIAGCINGVGVGKERVDPMQLIASCFQLPSGVRDSCATRLARLYTAGTWGQFTQRNCSPLGQIAAACQRGIKAARTPLSDGFPFSEMHTYGGYNGYLEPIELDRVPTNSD